MTDTVRNVDLKQVKRMFRRQKRFIICLPKGGQTKVIESAQKVK